MTYPSTRQLNMNHDSIGRLSLDLGMRGHASEGFCQVPFNFATLLPDHPQQTTLPPYSIRRLCLEASRF